MLPAAAGRKVCSRPAGRQRGDLVWVLASIPLWRPRYKTSPDRGTTAPPSSGFGDMLRETWVFMMAEDKAPSEERLAWEVRSSCLLFRRRAPSPCQPTPARQLLELAALFQPAPPLPGPPPQPE